MISLKVEYLRESNYHISDQNVVSLSESSDLENYIKTDASLYL